MIRELIHELWRNPPLAVYLAVGLVVAGIHMYRERMVAPAQQGGLQGLFAVALIIAGLWPLILLSMALNFMNGSSRRKIVKPENDEPPS